MQGKYKTRYDSAVQKVLCLYNTDYDDELTAEAGVDVSAVEDSARAVAQGIRDSGRHCDLLGLHGSRDLSELLSVLSTNPPDLVFNLVESMNGTTQNEAMIPYLLDLYGIPYTGPSGMSIAMCLHKDKSKHLLVGRGISTPQSLVVEQASQLEDKEFADRIQALPFPMFLKLSREDASIGIKETNVVNNEAEFSARASELLKKYKQPVLAERYIPGREVNVMLLGNGDGLKALPLHEIDFSDMPEGRPHIISYAAKWDEDHVDYDGTKPVPMKDLSPELEKRIVDVACQTFLTLGLRDFGRVDLRIDTQGQPWVIDVNPNCDISPDAGAARCARAAGLDYPQFIGRVCELAIQRHQSC